MAEERRARVSGSKMETVNVKRGGMSLSISAHRLLDVLVIIMLAGISIYWANSTTTSHDAIAKRVDHVWAQQAQQTEYLHTIAYLHSLSLPAEIRPNIPRPAMIQP